MGKVNPTAPQKAPPVEAPSAAPGTKEPKAKKEKKEKVKKIWHPLLNPNAEGKPTSQLDKIPDDFDPKLHKPFGRKHLKDESLFFELKARKYDALAADMRRQAEQAKQLGGMKDGKSAKKLIALQKRLDEQVAKMTAAGVDVAALLAAVKAKTEAAATPNEPTPASPAA